MRNFNRRRLAPDNGKANFMNAMQAVAIALLLPSAALADVISASDTHYVLKLTARSERNPDELWARLIAPATWWHPDHSYSGDAANLTLEAVAGGLWREDWHEGSVAHGTVMQIQHGKLLRMNAPFGPLQAVAAHAVWTITIEAAEDGGTVVIFDEVASAPPGSKLDELAEAVHFVKTEAIDRLTSL